MTRPQSFQKSILSLGTELDAIARMAEEGPVEFRRIVEEIGLRGHGILAFVLCLPFMQPIPLAGLSTIMGLVISGLGLMLAFNIPPWVPSRIANKKISAELLIKIHEVGHKLLCRVEKFVKPRGQWLRESRPMKWTGAMIIVGCGLLLALPLPIPFTNTIPALAIAAISLGLVEEDGYLIVIGFFIFGAAVIFISTVALVPILSIKKSFMDGGQS
jgi:hypothetical protein